MQFNSYIFILCFLPVFVLTYHITDRINRGYARYVAILAGGCSTSTVVKSYF